MRHAARLARLERTRRKQHAHREAQSAPCAVLVTVGKPEDQIERELAELRRRQPAGQTVILLDV